MRQNMKQAQNAWPALAAMALAGAVVIGAMIALPAKDKHEGGVSPEGPTVVVPSPSAVPTPRPLSLSLNLPSLNDEQMYWKDVAAVVPRCPICKGIDKPAIVFTDNEAAIYTALVYGECSYRPFDEWGNFKVNEIGARGCAQLMGNLVTDENMWNPTLNIYDGAREFRRLIDANNGDVMEALRNYRGVADLEHDAAATSVFSVLRIGG